MHFRYRGGMLRNTECFNQPCGSACAEFHCFTWRTRCRGGWERNCRQYTRCIEQLWRKKSTVRRSQIGFGAFRATPVMTPQEIGKKWNDND